MAVDQCKIPFDLLLSGAENLDVDNNSIDTVVSTYTFCTIPELLRALDEIKRVLISGGRVLFIEHGKAPDANVDKTQNMVNPLWRRVSGGCHLNRDIPELLQSSGFKIDRIEDMYLPGWRPATYNVWGMASIK